MKIYSAEKQQELYVEAYYGISILSSSDDADEPWALVCFCPLAWTTEAAIIRRAERDARRHNPEIRRLLVEQADFLTEFPDRAEERERIVELLQLSA